MASGLGSLKSARAPPALHGGTRRVTALAVGEAMLDGEASTTGGSDDQAFAHPREAVHRKWAKSHWVGCKRA